MLAVIKQMYRGFMCMKKLSAPAAGAIYNVHV